MDDDAEIRHDLLATIYEGIATNPGARREVAIFADAFVEGQL